MRIEYSVLAAILAAVYAILINYFPDFPITQQILLALALYVLAKLGVEVTAPAVRRQLIKRGFMQAEEYLLPKYED